MSEHRIELETHGEHLNVAQLMQQCDVALKDVTVFHRLSVTGGYYEVSASEMFLNSTILSGVLTVKFFLVKEEDRFGGDVVSQAPALQQTSRTLIECLGLDKLFGRTRLPLTEEGQVEQSRPVERLAWEVCIPKNKRKYGNSFTFLNLERMTLENAIWNDVFETVKTAVMYEKGVCLSNELLKAILTPLLKCLYTDWNLVLKW